MVDAVKEYAFASFALVVISAFAIGWYNFFVAPQDAVITEIIVCMDGDRSRTAYDRCVAELKK